MNAFRWNRNQIAALILAASFSLTAGSAAAQSAGARPTPPPEPAVKPIVSAPRDVDTDGTKLDDKLEGRVSAARATLARTSARTADKNAARATLASTVAIELVFDKQITQAQIDDFIAAGGKITKVFEAVSYGWTGTIPLDKVDRLPAQMGPSLLGVLESVPMELHIDKATQNARVRPYVWNAPIGIDGDPNITVAILDTGVSGNHTDLTGREQYWFDWTSDLALTSQDLGHHGSHVAGIAVGSGASAGAAPGSITYTDIGTFPGTVGSFFPTPITISASPLTMSSTLRWDTAGGGTAQLGHVVRNTAETGWATLSGPSSSTATPISEVNGPFSNPISGFNTRYSAYISWSVAGTGTRNYAAANTVSYSGIGDGYNLFRGVAPGARWAGLKVFQNNGTGNSTDIGEALDDIVTQRIVHNIKVANMSLGTIGDPGINTSHRNKTNTATANGIVVVVSAGNDGQEPTSGERETDDPGRAQTAITVAAGGDDLKVTAYSSQGFASPGDGNAGDEDMKPDIVAPGGSQSTSQMMSVDSNTSDNDDSDLSSISDITANDYKNIQGTSMAAPFIAGTIALMIDAYQQAGNTWDFVGAPAQADVLKMKQILLMTATETNQTREAGSSASNPTLNRGAKDQQEGFGHVNADAAIDAIRTATIPGISVTATDTFGAATTDRRCFANRLQLTASKLVSLTLTNPAGGDNDVYVYAQDPDSFGNPQILASSVNAGNGVTDTISFTPGTTQVGYLVVKRVAGSGSWSINGTVPIAVSDFLFE